MTRKRDARPPLRLNGYGNIIDADGEEVMECAKVPLQHVRQIGAAAVDRLRQMLVDRFNQYDDLVSLLRTFQRELSPLSAPAFDKATDLPRIYSHLTRQMAQLGLDPNITGGPAIQEIPPLPHHLRLQSADALWAAAYQAGYTSAWTPAPNDTTKDHDT